MKTLKLIGLALLTATACMFLGGCSTTDNGERPLMVPLLNADGSTNSFDINPGLKKSIEMIQGTQGLIPSPFGEAVTLGTGLASIILATIAKRKSDKLKSANGQLSAVVVGLEQAARTDASAKEAKQAIELEAQKNDVSKDLHSTVRQLT